MKIQRNALCPCGSGKKYKKCCLELDNHISEVSENPHLNHEKNMQQPIFHGFTSEFEDESPFNLNYENSCCHVMQANQSIADEQNALLKFEMLKSGDWFIMAKLNGEVKLSFKYKTAEAAMDVAREKFGAVRFLGNPDFI